MKTMLHDGLARAFLGETTLQEVFRVAIKLSAGSRSGLAFPPCRLDAPSAMGTARKGTAAVTFWHPPATRALVVLFSEASIQ